MDVLRRKIMTMTARPRAEFNKYNVLELLDSLKEAAHDLKHEKSSYYRAVYDTMREKIRESTEYFRELMSALLGDRDQEKVLERVSKVDKRYARKAGQDGSTPAKRGREVGD